MNPEQGTFYQVVEDRGPHRAQCLVTYTGQAAGTPEHLMAQARTRAPRLASPPLPTLTQFQSTSPTITRVPPIPA